MQPTVLQDSRSWRVRGAAGRGFGGVGGGSLGGGPWGGPGFVGGLVDAHLQSVLVPPEPGSFTSSCRPGWTCLESLHLLNAP